VKDALGNTIRDGDLIAWLVKEEFLRGMVFQVIKAHDPTDPTSQIAPQAQQGQGVLVIAVTIPIPHPEEELMDIRCLRNPQSEHFAEALPDVSKLRRH